MKSNTTTEQVPAEGTLYDCLLETAGFKFRQVGITEDPAKAYRFPTPVVFRDPSTMRFYRIADEFGALEEIAPAYGVLCGSIACWYPDKIIQKAMAILDGGRMLKPSMQPVSKIITRH